MARKTKIVAAGAVVLRPSKKGSGTEVLVIHRPEYKDWSLPKGKPEPDEDIVVTAAREVLEETNCHIRIGYPLGSESYTTSKGYKTVHWWKGHLIKNSRRKPDSEVDKVEWWDAEVALKKLSYPDERLVLQRALNVPKESSIIVVVRHAKAMDRKNWSKSHEDHVRPISARGRRQSKRLIDLLKAYGVSEVVSSSSTRCVQTVTPFAQAAKLTIEKRSELSEESFKEDPAKVTAVMDELKARSVKNPQGVIAVCGHRPVLPTMRAALGATDSAMQVAECQVLHLDDKGNLTTAERHRSPF